MEITAVFFGRGLDNEDVAQTTEYCSATRKDEILPFTTTWMDLETIMISEISQTESQEPYDFTPMWDIKLKATNEHTKTPRHR